tara:strand:- start:31 stop:168 length:138 start_codon:yes stop_codon:yes gene_type:complete
VPAEVRTFLALLKYKRKEPKNNENKPNKIAINISIEPGLKSRIKY